MRKLLAVLMVVVLAGVSLVGCGGSGSKDSGSGTATGSGSGAAAGTGQSNQSSGGADATISSELPSEFYSKFNEAKYKAIDRLSEGLSNNETTVFEAMSILGLIFVDLENLPATVIGQDQVAVETALGVFGAKDLKYTENGNNYLITYANDEGESHEFKAEWNPAAQSLICTNTVNGKMLSQSEIFKTSFGFISQDYVISDDGTAAIYQLAVQGEDGVVGIYEPAEMTIALKGSESYDFPKTAPVWFAITGNTITGLASDGSQPNFEYTPSKTE